LNDRPIAPNPPIPSTSITGSATDHATSSQTPGRIRNTNPRKIPTTSRIVSHSVAPRRPAANDSDARADVSRWR
jgi:hypothetical protein